MSSTIISPVFPSIPQPGPIECAEFTALNRRVSSVLSQSLTFILSNPCLSSI